ncbi:MAG: hypothetical protein WAK42_18290, partial [Mycobacterium sp.]
TSMMRRPRSDETFRTASVCAARGATFKTQRQLVAESLSSTGVETNADATKVTPAAILSLEFRFHT